MGIYIILTMVMMLTMVAIQSLCLYLYVLKIQPDFSLKLWYKSGFNKKSKKNKVSKNRMKQVRFDEIINIK